MRRLVLSLLVVVGGTVGCAHARPVVEKVPGAARRSTRTLRIAIDDDSVLVVQYPARGLGVSGASIERWVRRSAGAVRDYFGGFPVPLTRVVILPRRGSGVFGAVSSGPVPRVRVHLGRSATRATLRDDWVLTHEFVHVAFPAVRGQRWAAEGLATYVEPMARARAGTLSRQALWLRLTRGLPNGEPRRGDRGLDHTRSWARTYWGGALFYLVADVQIRRRTGNRFGLPDALQGINDAGGDGRRSWTARQCFHHADRAIPGSILTRLYEKHRRSPVPFDLPRLLDDLGVHRSGGRIYFDELAPLAHIRRALTGASPTDFALAAKGL